MNSVNVPGRGRIPRLILFVSLALGAVAGRAATLYFQPTADAQNNVNVNWFSLNNWYYSLNPVVGASNFPGTNDTAVVMVNEYDCVVGSNPVAVSNLIASANIQGGDFSVVTMLSSNADFTGSAITVQSNWDVIGTSLTGSTATIRPGGLLYLEASSEADGNGLYLNNSTLYDGGQIELGNFSELDFSSGTNEIAIGSNAQFTCLGSAVVYNGSPDLVFDNNGVVQSQDGMLLFQCDNTLWTNSLGAGGFTTLTTNAGIEFMGPFAVQSNNTNYFSGPGVILLFADLNDTINGLLQVGLTNPSPGIVQLDNGTFGGAGTVDVVGSAGLPSVLIWDSGTISGPAVYVDSWSELILTNQLKILSGSVISNAGTATWVTDGGDLQMDNGAVFDNLSTGVFTAENSAEILGGSGSSPSFFNNAGTLRKSVSVNSTSFIQDNPPAPSPYFVNSGLLDVESGAFYLEWGTNSGQFHVAQGAQLLLWRGTNTQTAAATFTGAGLLAVDGGDFWLANSLVMTNLLVEGTGLVDGPGDLTVNGLLNLAYGAVQGGGSLNMSSNASLLLATNACALGRNVNNAGTATVANVGLQASQPLTWNNLPGSSLILEGAALQESEFYAGSPPVLNNAGALINSGSNTSTIAWTVTNSGVIMVYPDNLAFNQTLTQISGSMEVEAGAELSVSTSYGHTLLLLGGTLEGQGEVSAAIVNSAAIHPGFSPGVLTIGFGSLTNNPGADLAVDIAGTAPGLQYSQINESGGQAWLNGLGLSVTFDNGFVPAAGQSFVIWTNAQINGVFASLQGIRPGGGIVMVPVYSSSMVTLVAATDAVLSPPSLQGAAAGFSFPTTAGRTNIVEYTVSLAPSNWQILTNFVGDGAVHRIMDPSATNASRFYRVKLQ